MIDGSQKITVGEKDYTLRLTFAATKNIELTLGKPLLHVNHISLYETAFCFSQMGDVSEEDAFDVIRAAGIEQIGVVVKTLIVETYNPEKK
ncbi:hypothetical protein [Paremcibacter congregatus]|uniref:hypothetical protein n=1 Tax=Paremcibacter congregatus TaxID=2043170 RepID=UPI0030EEEEB8|tara:strand:- start:3540 stop:3812 length:273 start_codon:yes stop_codon:yes gene_type:complete